MSAWTELINEINEIANQTDRMQAGKCPGTSVSEPRNQKAGLWYARRSLENIVNVPVGRAHLFDFLRLTIDGHHRLCVASSMRHTASC